jgi:hypothetical protein
VQFKDAARQVELDVRLPGLMIRAAATLLALLLTAACGRGDLAYLFTAQAVENVLARPAGRHEGRRRT